MTPPRRALLCVVLLVAAPSCRACKEHSDHSANGLTQRTDPDEEDDDKDEEQEELNARRPNYWRVQIAIVGQGSVRTIDSTLSCSAVGTIKSGQCGPKLLTFDELQPPLLRATGAPDWKFARWESQTRQPDGRMTPRAGPMPDGRWYLNGFGYRDTGALETVTAVFVSAGSGADDHASDEGR